MKRVLSFALALLILMASCQAAYAKSFSEDENVIEVAAQSVLLLEVYNSKNSLIGTGSGFIAFDNMTLITNYHVIEDAASIIAYSDNDRKYRLSYVLCADETMDVAILGFENPTDLNPLVLHADDDLKRGATVVTIGSPIGIKNTVSIGNISAVYEEDHVPWIQITAPISHGSSGGALFNNNGEVIGITSGGFEDGQNLNLAINIAVAIAMHNAWDGKTYTFTNHKSSAKMDFTGVYQSEGTGENQSALISDTSEWTCFDCGAVNNTKFCQSCGAARPVWTCSCGRTNITKFCGNCGMSAEKMIEQINSAFAYMDNCEYDKAIDIFSGMGGFNSGGLSTVRGNNISVADQVSEAYYVWAEMCIDNGEDYLNSIMYFEMAGKDYRDVQNRIDRLYYEHGVSQMEIGEYDAAIADFTNAGDYEDSEEKIKQCKYEKADGLLQENKFDNAIALFSEIKEYSDVKIRIQDAYYQKGQYLFENGSYVSAVTAFQSANNYKDSETQILKVYYTMGEMALEAGNYDTAIQNFSIAMPYRDAESRVDECTGLRNQYYYDQGKHYMILCDYDNAVKCFSQTKGYLDTTICVNECYYEQGWILLEQGEYDKAKEVFGKISDKSQIDLMKRETEYQRAMSYYDAKDNDKAIETLGTISNYDKARRKYQEINYECGISADDPNKALKYLTKAGNYFDTERQIYLAKDKKLQELLNKKSYTAAYLLYTESIAQGYPMTDYPIIVENDEDINAQFIVQVAVKMGFLSADKNTTKYEPKYVNGIKKMEEHFELTADGIITLNEFMYLSEVIYPGYTGDDAKNVLECLCDLGYIDSLPDEHSTYSNQYTAGVKKAEKALGLNADGFITGTEKTVILKQKINVPDAVKNLKASSSNGTVTLTWSASKKAKMYKVYRGSTLIATVKSTSYTDKSPVQNSNNIYKVYASNYNHSSPGTVASVFVDPVYSSVSLKSLAKDTKTYLHKYVTVTNVYKVSQSWSGGDLYMLCRAKVDGKYYYVYLLFDNYYSWDWDDGKGIASVSSLGSMTGKGQITEYKSTTNYGKVPVLQLTRITWYN